MLVLERQWHPTPALLPGKSHGQRSLVGCSPWGGKELETTEHACIRPIEMDAPEGQWRESQKRSLWKEHAKLKKLFILFFFNYSFSCFSLWPLFTPLPHTSRPLSKARDKSLPKAEREEECPEDEKNVNDGSKLVVTQLPWRWGECERWKWTGGCSAAMERIWLWTSSKTVSMSQKWGTGLKIHWK